MSKVAEISIDFHNVVVNSANYGMTQKNFHQFCGSKFKDIQPWIDKALKFISGIEAYGSLEHYDFGEHKEDIELHAISCLPFMMWDSEQFGALENPLKETKESYERSLQFLQYMKYHRMASNHYLSQVMDDFKGINEEKLDKALEIQDQLQIKKDLRNATTWWGKKESVIHLAWHLHLAWQPNTDKICKFISNFFWEMTEEELTEDNIKKNIYYKTTKENDGMFVRDNPHFFKDSLL